MTDQAPAAGGQGTEPGAASSSAALLNPPAGGAPPPPAGTTTTPISWLDGADETTVGYVQNKGWEKPAQVLDSYRNLEKLLGADKAGNAVVLPKPDAPQAEVDAFYNRLGRPSDPTGYKMSVPEGGDPTFANEASAKMHELGLSQKQGEALAQWWNEKASTTQTMLQQQTDHAYQADDLALKANWGAAFQQNLSAAQQAARGLGLDAPTIDKLQAAMGHKGTMEFLHKIGSKMGESDFVTGAKTERFGSAMTPGQAKAEITTKMADKNFTARYLSKDAEAVAEMKRLHEFAYPE